MQLLWREILDPISDVAKVEASGCITKVIQFATEISFVGALPVVFPLDSFGL
jgi:hypothetical protein